MAYHLNKDKHVGQDLTYIESSIKKKYGTDEIIGTNVKVFSAELMSTFNIVIIGKSPDAFKHIQKRSIVEFENLEVLLYIIDGKPIITRRATDINVILEQSMEDMLLAVDREYKD